MEHIIMSLKISCELKWEIERTRPQFCQKLVRNLGRWKLTQNDNKERKKDINIFQAAYKTKTDCILKCSLIFEDKLT